MKLLIFLMFVASSSFAKSAEDIHCLALNIYHESRGEPQEGQLAVAHVTLNRVASSSFPNTVCKVVWQRKQFSWTHDGKSDKPHNNKAWETSKRLAKTAVKRYNSGEDLSQGSLYFHTPTVRPSWAKSFKRVMRIGDHIFYKP